MTAETKQKTITIDIKKKMLPVGVLLGILCFVLLTMEGRKLGYAFGAIMFLLFCLASVLRIRTDIRPICLALNIFWALSLAFVTLLWTFFAIYLKPIAVFDLPLLNFVLNIAIFFCLTCVFLAISADWKKAVSFAATALFLLTFAAWLVWEFRGKQLIFSDIYATRTALNVLGQYSLLVNVRAAIGISLWLFFFFLQFMLPDVDFNSTKKLRIVSFLSCIAMMALIYSASLNIPTMLWSNYGFTQNGFFLNYYLSARDSFVSAPDNYSQESIEALENKYGGEESVAAQALPDILVIMNESFADLSQLGDNFNTDAPVMPYFDSLTENSIRGYAYTSVFGGGTANSEFEVLTGNSMGFLPSGSTPYEQYIKSESYSLPLLLKEYGYSSLATHPYNSSGWNRTVVYPLLGFDNSTFIEDYPQENILRYYVSDQEMYEYILAKLDKADSKQFLFGVTMQNHGGYESVENFTPTIGLTSYSATYPKAEQYLSLINASDKALEYLISELEKREKDTIVLFFGDHQPKVEEQFFEEIHGGSFDSLDEQMLKQKVPFLIWANYDIQEKFVEETSLNYLGHYLLEAAGIELPPYFEALKEIEKEVPVITAFGYKSKDKNCFISLEQAENTEKQSLNEYAILQHNNMFDARNKSDTFFSLG